MKGSNHISHRLTWRQRFFAHTEQVQIDLRIGKLSPGLIGQLQRKRSLPHAALPVKARDDHAPSCNRRPQFPYLLLAAREVPGRRRKLMQGIENRPGSLLIDDSLVPADHIAADVGLTAVDADTNVLRYGLLFP